MRTSLLVLAALVSVAGIATIASSAGAASVMADPAKVDTVATACGVAPGSAAPPLGLDLVPSKPVVGHQSVRGVGDDDGCGEGDHGGRELGENEGSGGSDD